jgi:hypothetical protein
MIHPQFLTIIISTFFSPSGGFEACCSIENLFSKPDDLRSFSRRFF